MSNDEAVSTVAGIVNREIQRRGQEPCDIRADSLLLGGDLPLDSLDLAAIVVELQGATGRDPFANGFIEFRTVGELARLFYG